MTALPESGRVWHLVARPHGLPRPEDVALREVPVTEPGEGRILVRNLHFSVDPYMRGRMNDAKSYVPPYQLDRPMDGAAVGEVIASGSADFAVGDHVTHGLGWREYAEFPAGRAVRVDASLAPLSAYLGVLGGTGLTAYAGLLEIGSLKEGDTVFVSGAAGAVGSQAYQLARIKGAARVIGSAARTRRSSSWSRSTASTRRSITGTARSGTSSRRPRRTVSTSTSTMSAASISKPRSPRSMSSAGSPCAARSRSTTARSRPRARAISPSRSAGGCASRA